MDNKENINKIEKQITGFKFNRNLCLVFCVYIVYSTIKGIKENPGPWYFYTIMGLLFAAAIAIIVIDSIKITKSTKRLSELNKELNANEPTE